MRASEALRRVFLDANYNCCEAILPDPNHDAWLLARVWADRPGTERYYWLGIFGNAGAGARVNTLYDNPTELMLAMQDLAPEGWGVERMSDGGHNVIQDWSEGEERDD
jgi:hypothetical protein